MPYITKEQRTDIDNFTSPDTAGQLNYLITTNILEYLNTKGLSYQTINDIVGALESSKAEFQRRIVAPYEDAKIIENGDLELYLQKGT